MPTTRWTSARLSQVTDWPPHSLRSSKSLPACSSLAKDSGCLSLGHSAVEAKKRDVPRCRVQQAWPPPACNKAGKLRAPCHCCADPAMLMCCWQARRGSTSGKRCRGCWPSHGSRCSTIQRVDGVFAMCRLRLLNSRSRGEGAAQLTVFPLTSALKMQMRSFIPKFGRHCLCLCLCLCH